jgi:ABC-type transporter Mla subunit MlaD
MDRSAFETLGQQMDDTVRNATRAASAVGDVLEDGVIAAQRAAKRGTCAATELLDDTKKSLQRHPRETAAAIFATGVAAGVAISWILRRKQS